VLHLIDISLYFGSRLLFENIHWHVRPKDRIALIGANGIGKSTLLKIILGRITPTTGRVVHAKNLTIGYLPQEGLPEFEKSVIEESMSAFRDIQAVQMRLNEIEDKIKILPHDSEAYQRLLQEYGECHHRFEQLEGFSARSRAEKVLIGLGFRTEDFERPCSQFSGGWQMRVSLAKLLLQKPDLLLLDEPTNHLDIESIVWFEDYLKSYEGSVVTVSHDRYFIDHICNRISELDHQRLTDYSGDYEAYEEAKALAEEQLIAEYERQQDERRRIQVFIDRFRYKATKARQVQSRVKMLEKMEQLNLPEDERKAVHFRFPQPPPSGRVVLEVEDLTKSYDGIPVFEKLNFILERGDKAALVGVNGAGKSTLLRLLSGEDTPDRGAIKIGYNVMLEYFAQQQAEKLNIANTVFEEITAAARDHTPLLLRTILGAFLFSGDDIQKPVKILSGGEKSRLAFAKMLLNPTNFILLDEPTNHIDAQTRDILQSALQDYEGTLLIASHDRYFLDNLVTKVLELKNGRMKIYLGNYTDYYNKKINEASEVMQEAQNSSPNKKSEAREQWQKEREQNRREAAEQRRRERRIAEIEKLIHEQEQLKSSLEHQLADPLLYKDADRIKAVQEQYRRTVAAIDDLYIEWEELS